MSKTPGKETAIEWLKGIFCVTLQHCGSDHEDSERRAAEGCAITEGCVEHGGDQFRRQGQTIPDLQAGIHCSLPRQVGNSTLGRGAFTSLYQLKPCKNSRDCSACTALPLSSVSREAVVSPTIF